MKHSDLNLKITTIRYDYCDIISTSYNEFQASFDADYNANLITAGSVNKSNHFNLTVLCIGNNKKMTKSLTVNTLYFWLRHTICIFIPFLVMLIFLFLLVYILRHKENFYQNYYYFLNKNNSLENIVTIKTLVSHYQLPSTEINLLKSKFNFLLTERYNMTIMYFIQIIFYFIFILPYILFRLILELYLKEKIKFNLDFYVLYKITFLFFHLNFIISFFLFVIFSFKFRLSLFKVTTCNKFCVKSETSSEYNNNQNDKSYNIKSVTDFNVDNHKYFMPSNLETSSNDSQTVVQTATVVVNGDSMVDNDQNFL